MYFVNNVFLMMYTFYELYVLCERCVLNDLYILNELYSMYFIIPYTDLYFFTLYGMYVYFLYFRYKGEAL